MSTFIGQLIGFAVIVFLLWRYVVPPVRRLMSDRQEAVRKQLNESEAAKKRLEEGTRAHDKALKEAKDEAKIVIEEARADAERLAEQLREQADAEVERVKVQGEKQIQLLRAQLIRQLRQDLGAESVRRAGDLVREHVADDDARSATVDRFIDELDEMAPSDALNRSAAAGKLRSASRASLSATVEQFEEVTDALDADGLSSLADELAAVVKLLIREPILTRHLAEPCENPEHKNELVDRLFAGKIGEPTLKVLKAAACNRWSDSSDLIHAVEHVARLPLLVRADRDDQVAEVEEQLFRFGRVLFGKPRLDNLLSDYTAPADGRVKLLKDVLASSQDVNPVTAALLIQTVELVHGQRFDEAVMDLNELAVARRGEVIAHVKAATELTDSQRNRLTEVLGRVYRHPVSLQLEIQPAVLGGLSISVGDEVIDGTLSSRLARAQTHLPD